MTMKNLMRGAISGENIMYGLSISDNKGNLLNLSTFLL